MPQPNTPYTTTASSPIGGDMVLPVSDEGRNAVPDGSVGQPAIAIQQPIYPGANDKAMTDSLQPKF